MAGLSWNDREIELLKNHYPILHNYDLPAIFHKRTSRAVESKASRLKIKKGKPLHSQVVLSTESPYHLTLIEKAYIAGLFDGEGSLPVHQALKKDGFKVRYANLTVTNKETIYWLKNKLKAGHIHTYWGRNSKKLAYMFCITKTDDVYWFLREVVPFLIIKRNLAKESICAIEQKYQWKIEHYKRREVA